MLKAIIVDDEPNGVQALQILLGKYCPQVNVLAACTDPEKGLREIEEKKPDLVFLDVNMPKMDGFELLSRLKFHDFKLVFTTAHREHAIRAIKLRAADYLLKPVDADELMGCVGRLVGETQPEKQKKPEAGKLVELSVKDGIIYIRQHDIVRLEASGSYTTFYLENGVKHVASRNLKDCESMLDPNLFFRCHPSHVVNLKKVEKLVSTDGLFVKMSDGSMPELSRKNKELLLEKLKSA
jgi:two-component system, LytTR family, response regulator